MGFTVILQKNTVEDILKIGRVIAFFLCKTKFSQNKKQLKNVKLKIAKGHLIVKILSSSFLQIPSFLQYNRTFKK